MAGSFMDISFYNQEYNLISHYHFHLINNARLAIKSMTTEHNQN